MLRANAIRVLRSAGSAALSVGLVTALLAACSGTIGPSGATALRARRFRRDHDLRGRRPISIPPPRLPERSPGHHQRATGRKIPARRSERCAYSSLPAADIGFAIAQLVPGRTHGESMEFVYLWDRGAQHLSSRRAGVCDGPQDAGDRRGRRDRHIPRQWRRQLPVHVQKGHHKDPNVIYDATLTHRWRSRSATSRSRTTPPTPSSRRWCDHRHLQPRDRRTATCDNCHTSLTAHGARVEVQYCVMCHNPGRPTRTATTRWTSRSWSTRSTPVTHCQHPNCEWSGHHADPGLRVLDRRTWCGAVQFQQGALPAGHAQLYDLPRAECASLTEAAHYATVPTMEACGACHDKVNFATGANHSTANIIANNAQCTTCHGTTSTLDNGALQVVAAHVIPEIVAAGKFRYIVNSVTFTTDARRPSIRW